MNYYLKRNQKINNNGMVCIKCGEFKTLDNFEESERNQLGYISSCNECREKEKIQITEEERISFLAELNKKFFEDEVIKNNLKILGDKLKFSDEDKFLFFLSRGYDKKWLEFIFQSTYRLNNGETVY